MGNYSLWPVFDSLGLGIPESVEALPSGYSEIADQISKIYPNDFSFPNACIVKFKLPASGELPPLDLYWYDGGMRPMTPDELRPDKKAMPATGLMFVGDKGKIHVNRGKLESDPPSIIQEPLQAGEVHLYKSDHHHTDWYECIKSGKPPICDVEVGHRSATVCHLGNIASRLGRSIRWDPRKERIVGDPEAAKMQSYAYRKPWKLPKA